MIYLKSTALKLVGRWEAEYLVTYGAPHACRMDVEWKVYLDTIL